ncbi:MAG: GAF domain-containing protein [Anaerolineales bacterium]|nr:GAF domain-containing protein [Anaerolineales bacterium]MCB0010925.1 GAF domain-containing protein [Anaerolineales bacterium]MCB0017152.1 GAF domain-containing protein [Anaerolineales bacterium]MCB8960804.1 GAF domain-containing protein [Ardenticatenales bacterium]
MLIYGACLVGMGMVNFVAGQLIRRERYSIGFLLLTLVISAHLVITSFFIRDASFVLLGFDILIIWLISREHVNTRWQVALMVGTAVIGTGMVLLDFYVLPEYRAYSRFGQLLIAAIASISLLYALWRIFHEYRDYPLRSKLITATLFAAVVSIGVNIFIQVQLSSAALTQDIGQDLERLAESEALAVSEFMARQIDVLNSLTLNGTLRATLGASNQLVTLPRQSDDPVAQGEFVNSQWAAATDNDIIVTSRLQNGAANALLQFQEFFGLHRELLVTDLEGNLVAATQRTDVFYFGDEAWWQSSYNEGQGGVFIGDPIVGDNRTVLWVHLAMPVRDPSSGEMLGILHSRYDLEQLLDVLAERGEDRTSGSIDLLVSGRLFDTYDITGIVPSIEFENLVDVLGPTTVSLDEFFITTYEGERSFIAIAGLDTLGHVPAIDALDWGILVHQSENEALLPVLRQTRATILVGFGILAFTTIIAAYVAGLIARPIVRLTETAVQVAGGDLTARAEATTSDEMGVLSASFNTMTQELQRSVQELELRVAERTRALDLSAQVGRKLTTILDTDQLLQALVEELQSAFGYYHVQVYLREGHTNRLMLRGSSGEVGQKLLERGHTLLLGQGIVGQAAARMAALVVPDVSRNSMWFPNELLPSTRAEMAVPITVGEQLMGVIDIQHDLVNGLTNQDVSTVESIAAQVATALQNARSYERARSQAAQEALINEIGQKIQSTTDVDRAMQVAIRELGRALGKVPTRVTLYPRQPEADEADELANDRPVNRAMNGIGSQDGHRS